MARRYEVTDEQWKIIEPHLGNKAKRTGRPQADNRKLFNGVLWILRTGAPWREDIVPRALRAKQRDDITWERAYSLVVSDEVRECTWLA